MYTCNHILSITHNQNTDPVNCDTNTHLPNNDYTECIGKYIACYLIESKAYPLMKTDIALLMHSMTIIITVVH